MNDKQKPASSMSSRENHGAYLSQELSHLCVITGKVLPKPHKQK